MTLLSVEYADGHRLRLTVRLSMGEKVEIFIREPTDGTILVGVPLSSVVQYLRRRYWPLWNVLKVES